MNSFVLLNFPEIIRIIVSFFICFKSINIFSN